MMSPDRMARKIVKIERDVMELRKWIHQLVLEAGRSPKSPE